MYFWYYSHTISPSSLSWTRGKKRLGKSPAIYPTVESLLLHYYSTTTPLLLHYYSTTTPLPLHYYSTTTPLPLHYHSTTTPIQLQYHSNTTPTSIPPLPQKKLDRFPLDTLCIYQNRIRLFLMTVRPPDINQIPVRKKTTDPKRKEVPQRHARYHRAVDRNPQKVHGQGSAAPARR